MYIVCCIFVESSIRKSHFCLLCVGWGAVGTRGSEVEGGAIHCLILHVLQNQTSAPKESGMDTWPHWPMCCT